MIRRVIIFSLGCFAIACALAGCTALQSPRAAKYPELQPYLGLYRGSFDSALTDDPTDDLDHDTCRPDDTECARQRPTLTDVLLDLRQQPDGTVTLQFFRARAERDAGRPLDLLGSGCGTRLGALESLEQTDEASGRGLIASFPLTAETRLCLAKLRPVSKHYVRLAMQGVERGERRARVILDRRVRDTNYLYVVEDGVRRRVKIDLDNTVHENHVAHYRVCIENDLGEYERCVLTDREFHSIALPLPLPGGAAVSYTWWQSLRPRLHSTRGGYVVERYVGRFEPVVDATGP